MKTNTLKFHSGLAVSGTSAAATAGAAVEAAIGAARYGFSDAYQQGVHQTVEDYGFARGRHVEVVNYDFQNAAADRAIKYASRVSGHPGHFSYIKDAPVSTPSARGDAGAGVIYENAFYEQGLDGKRLHYDPSGVFQAVDHEYMHITNNSYATAEWLGYRLNGGQVSRSTFVEWMTYSKQLDLPTSSLYSDGIKKYVNSQIIKLSPY